MNVVVVVSFGQMTCGVSDSIIYIVLSKYFAMS